jgi:hypothetical protein
MGADIHMYVEYRNKKQAKDLETQGRDPYWYSFGDCFNPGRNYTMFAILAGVRGEFKDSFEPKGRIPFNLMGNSAKHDLYYFIDDKEGERTVTREQAKKYSESYGCEIVDDSWVRCPDFHSHSWMSSKELEKAYKGYKVHASKEWDKKMDVPVEWKAILAAMKSLEDEGKNEVRVVFWFDS